MNEKITFPRLASLIADKSGRSKRFSEDFLREFFALISERLETGDIVKVKGFGTFKLSRVEPRRSVDVTTGEPMEISGHSKVVFIPSKELAEAVNAPFEAFNAIEISDNADLSNLFPKEEIELEQSEESDGDGIKIGTVSTYEPEHILDSELEQPTEPESKIELERELEPKAAPATEPEPEPESIAEIPESETEDDNYKDEAPATRRKAWRKTLMISLGAAVLALFATIAVWYVFATNDFNRIFNRTAATTNTSTDGIIAEQKAISTSEGPTIEPGLLTEDSVAESEEIPVESEVPTAPSDPVVYDTISTTRYLTTMARSHYGNFNLWPYIYEENKARLGHPDRIRPGTPVVIPKLSKYGVDPTNSEDIEKAKKMGIEIYARYGKKI